MAEETGFDGEEVERLLQQLAGIDFAPIMHVVAEGLVLGVDDMYETAGHGLWAPLAPSTLKRRRGDGGQILKDTGVMAASTFADWGDDFAEAATGDAKIVFHASRGARAKIPYRNPFDLPDADVDAAAEQILDFARRRIGG